MRPHRCDGCGTHFYRRKSITASAPTPTLDRPTPPAAEGTAVPRPEFLPAAEHEGFRDLVGQMKRFEVWAALDDDDPDLPEVEKPVPPDDSEDSK
jgi:hypothetical protein